MGPIGEKLRLVPIGRLDLPTLVLDLAKEPRVLYRQRGLSRKRLKKVYDFRRKVARLLSPDRQGAHDSFLSEKWNRQHRPIPETCKHGPHASPTIFPLV